MNILIVHNYYKIPGGEDTVVKNEIELLKSHGHNVYTYFKYNSKLKTTGLNKLKIFKQTIFNKSIKKDLKTLICKYNIEIVHCHNTFPIISPSVYKYAKKFGCKVFQTIHNFRFLCASGELVKNGQICEKCLERNIYCSLKDKCYHNSFLQTLTWVLMQKKFRRTKGFKNVDKFICLTEFNKKLLSYIIPPEKICIKPNGSKFNLDYSEEEKSQFLFVGRVEDIKGLDILISAFSKQRMPVLKICGSGKDVDKYKKLANGYKNIEFVGFLEKEELKKEWKKSYALIVPSKWYEGFPMVISESFSLGIPVIANNIGNLPYIIKDNYNGLIYNRNDEVDLGNKVKSLIKDIKLRKTLSKNAFETFSSELTNEINYKSLIDIYKS